jgi:glycerol uptake facilitator protein
MSGHKALFGEILAEFLGTLVLIALGDGVVAMVVLFGAGVPGEVVKGGYTNITLGWGLAVLMGICVAGRVSGAHLNPAVTLALAVFRGFPWRKVLPYVLAQVLGAFAGAALVYVNYLPAFRHFDPDLSKTANVFTTFPAYPDAWGHGLFDQVVGTAFLVGLILAITDSQESRLQPLLVGLVVVAIGMSWGGDARLCHQPGARLRPAAVHPGGGVPRHGLRQPCLLGADRRAPARRPGRGLLL